eukprot:TRINITY_DN51059_c0_g1_i1.p1 TRINITY_DN51059_c0_g1~~TRINITY_DN51059_c0_g1_i1.p1  ORF type:complete len:229 (+),score=56.63 TRINITY_DN51059_c0_g1_i1:119-805(+)
MCIRDRSTGGRLFGLMAKLTVLARLSDHVLLAQSSDNAQFVEEGSKERAKRTVFEQLVVMSPESPTEMKIEAGPEYILSMANRGICTLALYAREYPVDRARFFLRTLADAVLSKLSEPEIQDAAPFGLHGECGALMEMATEHTARVCRTAADDSGQQPERRGEEAALRATNEELREANVQLEVRLADMEAENTRLKHEVEMAYTLARERENLCRFCADKKEDYSPMLG